jgi:alkanesulfonate monooxygenase SsuD/methylene tetrahydromethanopterin reductase-like flavin-dependent oxidoreductase (luciferase family)
MQYGVTLPNVGVDARILADLARDAEVAGWDGVFVWDSVHSETSNLKGRPTCDPWIALTAIAMSTERVHFGPMVTPPTRRRPWKLARETASLDQLSNGRLILPVGLGWVGDGGFSKVGEELDRKKRAQMLDESLDILTGLWSGQPFSFDGEHYHLQEMTFLPTPAQSPRIPIWVVGAWPRNKSIRRALLYDGIIPAKMSADGSFAEMTPADIQELKLFVNEHRIATTPFDIVMEGETPGNDHEKAASIVQPLAEVGVTWWLEAVWGTPETQGGVEGMRKRIKLGPPRVG